MLVVFTEVFCNSTANEVKKYSFAVKNRDVVKVHNEGELLATGEKYSEIVVIDHETHETSTHRVLGSIFEIVDTINCFDGCCV